MKQESNNIMSINDLSNLIELITGSTYPLSVLKRRMNLLNEKETEHVLHLMKSIELSVNVIDEIISNRAEIENDPWKL